MEDAHGKRVSDLLATLRAEVVYELDLKKQENENDEQFIWRICRYKDSGLLDVNWDDVADIINKELGMEDTPFTEAAFRKPYQQAKRFYDAGVFTESAEDEYLSELRLQRQELEKEKVKVRDERNELRRVLREEARKESYVDLIKRTISESVVEPLLYEAKNIEANNDNDLIVTLFDLHAGMNVDNYFNTFNDDVLRDRIHKYLDKIIEIKNRHKSDNVCVIMSELLSGLIHPAIRIENNQNLIEQFVSVCEYISEFLAELSKHFISVSAFMAPGNHSRLTPNKDQSLRNENMDLLALPYLRAKLQHFDNVVIYDNDIDCMIAMFRIRNQTVFAVHGDKTTMNNVTDKLTSFVGVRPDIIYMGHMHTNAMATFHDTKVIQAGTLMGGGDGFCLDKMLRNKPEQVVSVISDDGLECNYDVKF